MASYLDRMRAAGAYQGRGAFPRHKPDPRDPSQDFADEQWSPPPMDPGELAARGGGSFGSTGGGQEADIAPTTPVMGAQPTQPGVGPQSTVSDYLQRLSRGTDRGQQMAAGDASFRQQQTGIDGNYHTAMLDALPPEQKAAMATAAKSNPMFLSALATRLGNPGMVGMLRNYFGVRPQTPPLPAMTGPAPQPEQPMPQGLSLYARAGETPPASVPRDRVAAVPARNSLALYQH